MAGSRGRKPNSVRIIGGDWRGRRLRFPGTPGLRPSSDRRRETLFNWLAPELPGASCLDLFAGSGALGFEALSRGAARVVLVESSREVVTALMESRRELAAEERADIVLARAAGYLGRDAVPFDIVFLDPPFAMPELAANACERLEAGWLAPGASVYLELPARAERPRVPSGWRLSREMVTGDAHALLFVADCSTGE